jgi:hypothetical protein
LYNIGREKLFAEDCESKKHGWKSRNGWRDLPSFKRAAEVRAWTKIAKEARKEKILFGTFRPYKPPRDVSKRLGKVGEEAMRAATKSLPSSLIRQSISTIVDATFALVHSKEFGLCS